MYIDEADAAAANNGHGIDGDADGNAIAMQMFRRTAEVLLEIPRGSKHDGKNKYHTLQDDLGVLLRHWQNFATNKENATDNSGPASRADAAAKERLRKRDSARKLLLQKGASSSL